MKKRISKHTYQDWVEGKLTPEMVQQYYFRDKTIDNEDFGKIIKEQENAYLRRLKESVEIRKYHIMANYHNSFLKDEFLAHKIEELERQLIEIDEENPSFKEQLLKHNAVWRVVSRQDVENYLLSDWKDRKWVASVVYDDCFLRHITLHLLII